MTLTELRIDLIAMLMDSADRFTDPDDFDRHLNAATVDLSRVMPRIVSESLSLVADESFYDAPADLMQPRSLDWGMKELGCRKPWNSDYPGRLPRLEVLIVSGERKLMLSPPPSADQISLLGSDAAYRYSGRYTLDDVAENTTVPDTARHLLLLRALAEAMQDLANRGVSKPVTLGGKAGLSVPKNGSPAYMAEQLLKRFEEMAK